MPRHKPQIHDLKEAIGQNYFGLTDATGVQQYRQLDPGDFTVSGDVNNNGMSFADVVNTNAPAITASPPGFAGVIANNGTLMRRYDDLIRVWQRTNGVWMHIFDYSRRRSVFVTQTVVDYATAIVPIPPGPTMIGPNFFIVPEMLNNALIYEWKCAAASGTGNSVVSFGINGLIPACGTAAIINTAVTTTLCVLTTVAEDDVINFICSGGPGTLQAGATVTIEFLLPT